MRPAKRRQNGSDAEFAISWIIIVERPLGHNGKTDILNQRKGIHEPV